jgi:hypothetical protein
VTEKEEAGKEGDGKGPGAIAFFERGEVQGEQEEPVEDETRSDVDEEIDEMVAEDLETSEVIVQGESEIGKKPYRITVQFDQLVEPGHGEGHKADTRVCNDIGGVIKLEGNLESVGIGHQGNGSHEENHKKALDGEARVPVPDRNGFGRFERRSLNFPIFPFSQKNAPQKIAVNILTRANSLSELCHEDDLSCKVYSLKAGAEAPKPCPFS